AEPPLGAAGRALQSLQLSGPLRSQLGVSAELRLAFFLPPIQLAPDIQNVVPLLDHPVSELLDVLDQRPILLAGEIEILVPAEQIPERLGGKEDLKGVQRAPFVDVDQPSLQHGPTFSQVILRQDQLGAGTIELRSQASDLALDLAHDPLGGLALP